MSSIIDPSASFIVKSDRAGRTRYTAQYKQEIIAAYESSSLSAPAFATQCGIKYPTFAEWIAGRKRDESKPAPKSASAFTLAEFSTETGASALEVRLPG